MGSKKKGPRRAAEPSEKQVRQRSEPSKARPVQKVDPEEFYPLAPKWAFRNCDQKCWSLYDEKNGALFSRVILPRVAALETQTWNEIFKAKKQNHSIEVAALNSCAVKRLDELQIEADSVYSLRVNGTTRIYGFFLNNAFNVLWIDDDHGDNDTCVCRSVLKNT